MPEFPVIVTAGLAKQIAESLREHILSGRIKVDERLPTEEELARQFSVSRPTIREALKRLAAENLIQSRRGPRGGATVRQPRPQEISLALSNALRLLASLGQFDHGDIIEARCELESTCCRLVARRRSKDYLERMRAELATQRDPLLSDEEFCASDVRFHRTLVEATKNPILEVMLSAVSDALQPVTNLVVFRFRDRKVICQQHQRLIQALEASDADKAISVLQRQARYLAESYGKARTWRQAREQQRARAARPAVAR